MANQRILRVARILANILVSVLAIFALYLLIFGQELTVVQESVVGATSEGIRTSEIQREFYPPAVVLLLGSLMLLIGNMRNMQWLAWSGFSILLLFSFLFFFSSGAALLPIVLIILIALLVISFVEASRK